VTLTHGGGLELLKSVVMEYLQSKVVSGILLLSDGPVAIIVVQGIEVVVKILINFEISNLDIVREPSSKVLVDLVSEQDGNKEHPEEDDQGESSWDFIALAVEY
jgi:hypothetical protein